MSFLESIYPSAQSQSAVNTPLLESSVLTLDLKTHPHLTHVVSYSKMQILGELPLSFRSFPLPLRGCKTMVLYQLTLVVCVKQACFKMHMHFSLFLQD